MKWEGVGEERWEGRGSMDGREMGMYEKIAQKCDMFGICGRPWGIPPCHTFLESSFHEQNLSHR